MDLNDEKKSENEVEFTNLKQTQAGDSLDKNSIDNLSKINDKSNEQSEFDSEEWLDLLDNKDILRKILVSLEPDPLNPSLPRANRGARVWINLETKIFSTQQLILSECFQNLEVIVGDYDVIHGIDLVLPMMQLYEKSRVLINPRFGYGSKGKLPDVEPDCRLDCTVDILKIQDDLDECSFEEKVSMGEKKKARGNFWFLREEYQTAISCYRKCVDLFENVNEEELDERATRLLIDSYNNLSFSQFKTDSLNLAIESVDKALFYDPKNVKSLFRKASILEKKNDLEEAIELLKAAIEIEPNNSAVANLLTKLRKRRLIELETEKKLYQKMISNNEKNTVQKDEFFDNQFNLDECKKDKISIKFHYAIFTLGAIIAVIIAFLVNNYLINHS